jgi:hypothetical protein
MPIPTDPVEAGQQLVLKHGKTTKSVSSLDELAGSVHIASAADALAYVRLRANPLTYRFFTKPYRIIEILPRDAFTTDLVWRDTNTALTVKATKGSGAYGLVQRKLLVDNGYSPPSVIAAPDGRYTITRWVLREIAPMRFVDAVATEVVSRLGKYSISTKPLPNISLEWMPPGIE